METATNTRSSICEFGLTVVENSKIVETRNWLIQPPGNAYSSRNTGIHGIKAVDTIGKKCFAEVWKEILPYLENKVVVSHNTSFDMYCIAAALREYNMPLPTFDYFCSIRVSQRCFRVLSYSLSNLCQYLNIEFDQKHRAGSDSDACAKVMLKCLEKADVTSFDELESKLFIKRGIFRNGSHVGLSSTKSTGGTRKKYVSNADPSKFDPTNYFFDKVVMFTGTMSFGNRNQMRALIDDIGGHSIDKFKNDVEVLVIGALKGDSTNKIDTCQEKLDKGGEVEVLSEDEFYERYGCWL